MRNYSIDYSGFVNPPDSAYPYSSPKNATTDTAEDGTPVEEKWVGDVWGFFQSAVSKAGVAPNGQTESVANPQILNAISKYSLTMQSVVNRIKNQNFIVKGREGNDVPNTSSVTYQAGQEISAGVLALTSCTLSRSSSGLLSGSGTYKVTVSGDFPSDFYGVKKQDGTVSKSGVSISTSPGITEIQVIVDTVGEHKFPQLSEQEGIAPDISNDEDASNYESQILTQRSYIDVTGNRSPDTPYRNSTPSDIEVRITYSSATANSQCRVVINVDGELIDAATGFSTINEATYASVSAIVKPNQSYTFTEVRGSLRTVKEYKHS